MDSNSRKRYLELNDADLLSAKLTKIPNNNKSSIVPNFPCDIFYRGRKISLYLTDFFQSARFAVLFFCPYDFSPESRKDLDHIQKNYQRFADQGALPIVITLDRLDIHEIYATPGGSPHSLTFVPSFVMASDSKNRFLSDTFDALDVSTKEINRSVAIINQNLEIVYHHQVAKNRFFPMESMLRCFGP